MQEIEVPLESAHEEIHKAAHEAGGWLRYAALASALLAALAAVAALMAGHFANEAMLEQIKAGDHWSFYQAKSIKASLVDARLDMLPPGAAAEARAKLTAKSSDYKREQKEIEEQAGELERESQAHLQLHQTFARAVTFFQVAIAIAAIAVLARRRRYFGVALAFGGVGLAFMVQALVELKLF